MGRGRNHLSCYNGAWPPQIQGKSVVLIMVFLPYRSRTIMKKKFAKQSSKSLTPQGPDAVGSFLDKGGRGWGLPA